MKLSIIQAEAFVTHIQDFLNVTAENQNNSIEYQKTIDETKQTIAGFARQNILDFDDLLVFAEAISTKIPKIDKQQVIVILELVSDAVNLVNENLAEETINLDAKLQGYDNVALSVVCKALMLNEEDYLNNTKADIEEAAETSVMAFYQKMRSSTTPGGRDACYQRSAKTLPNLINDLFDAYCIFNVLTPNECIKLCRDIAPEKWNKLIAETKDYFLLTRFLTIEQRKAIASTLVEINSDFAKMINDRLFVKKHEALTWHPTELNDETFYENMTTFTEDEIAALAKLSVAKNERKPATPKKLVIHSANYLFSPPAQNKLFQSPISKLSSQVRVGADLIFTLGCFRKERKNEAKAQDYKDFFMRFNDGEFFKIIDEFLFVLESLFDDTEQTIACDVFKHNVINIIYSLSDYEKIFTGPISKDRLSILAALEINIKLTVAIFDILEKQRMSASKWLNAESDLVKQIEQASTAKEKLALIFSGINTHPTSMFSRAWQHVRASNGDINSLIIAVHLDAFEIGAFNTAQFFGQTYYTRSKLQAAYEGGERKMMLDSNQDPLLNAIKDRILLIGQTLVENPQSNIGISKILAK